MGHYLVCYDIANPKRLSRVHRRAVKHAVFVQYSVYYLLGDENRLHCMLAEIEELIDDREDDVRAYLVAPLRDATQLGTSFIPESVHLAALNGGKKSRTGT